MPKLNIVCPIVKAENKGVKAGVVDGCVAQPTFIVGMEVVWFGAPVFHKSSTKPPATIPALTTMGTQSELGKVI